MLVKYSEDLKINKVSKIINSSFANEKSELLYILKDSANFPCYFCGENQNLAKCAIEQFGH